MHTAWSLEQLVTNFVAVLAASVCVLLISHRLRISPVVGLLVTGMLIGPSGLELVRQDEVELFAEIGVVVLLFTIGLEVSLLRLRQTWRAFLVGGGLQVALTLVAAAAVAAGFGMPLRNAVFFGFLAALSSTAIVLKAYADRQELQSPQGTLSAGILLFQDFAVAPMILLVPLLSGATQMTALGVLGRLGLGVLVVGLVFVLARTLVPRALGWIVGTRMREVFVLSVLAACMGMALLTSKLGFSLALGAFLAGLIISESDYSHQVTVEVLPFRDLFNSLFFISVGMLLDFGHVGALWPQVLALGAALLVGKALLVALVAAYLGYPSRIALIVALGLAQVGEFSFVLGRQGLQQGLLDETLFQAFLGASIFTMLLTPILIQIAPRVAARTPALAVPRPLQRLRLGGAAADIEAAKLERHVIVIGYGTNGRNLCRVLGETAIPFVVIELDSEAARRARNQKLPILFGDATRPEILSAAGLREASMIVVAISDLVATRQVLRVARADNPQLYTLVRTRAVDEVEDLYAHGADEVIPEEFETSVEIFSRVLEHYHIPRNVIMAQVRIIRGEGYQLLRRGARSVTEHLDRINEVLEATLTDTFLVRVGSPADGKSLRELDLRRRSGGASVIAVVRRGTPHANPPVDMKLMAHDTLVLVGHHAALQEAATLLQGDVGQLPGLRVDPTDLSPPEVLPTDGSSQDVLPSDTEPASLLDRREQP